MAIKLYIIRHGEPHERSGRPNPGLSERGKVQAERAAQQMAEWRLDCIYSSTYRRALETARPIQEKTGAPWHMWPALSETGRGRWPAVRAQVAGDENWVRRPRLDAEALAQEREDHPPVSELVKQYPVTADQPFPWPDDWHLALRNETREEAYARAERCIEAVKARHKDGDRVALVCHGAFGSVLLTVLSEGPPCDHNRFSFAHAAIARVDLFNDGTTMLELVDHIAHLMPDLVTQGPDFG